MSEPCDVQADWTAQIEYTRTLLSVFVETTTQMADKEGEREKRERERREERERERARERERERESERARERERERRCEYVKV